MKRPAAATVIHPPAIKRPSGRSPVTSTPDFERSFGWWTRNSAAARRARAEFAAKVAEATRVGLPAWVLGARPSHECIAVHSDFDVNDTSELPTAEREEFVSKRTEPDDKELLYQLPINFQEEHVDAFGVPCIWTNWPGTSDSAPVIMFFHGGALVSGSAKFCSIPARLSCLSSLRVLSVDYRLAPEHPMPAATQDCVQAYRWLLEDQGISPAKISVVGSSSGGALVVLMLQELLKSRLPLPACASPISAFRPNPVQVRLWHVITGNEGWDGESLRDPPLEVHSPQFDFLAGEFSGLPPLYVVVGSAEHCCNMYNSKRLVEMATAARVQVELDVACNLGHTPLEQIFVVPESTACAARVVRFMRRALGCKEASLPECASKSS